MPTSSWAVVALKQARWQTGIFACPSDAAPKSVPGAFVSQTATDLLSMNRFRDSFADMSGDGAFMRRKSSKSGASCIASMETEAGTGLDKSYDVDILWDVPARGAKTCQAQAKKGSTGRDLGFHMYDGKPIMSPLTGTSPKVTVPVIW